jgi:hypothetical protein
VLSNLAAPVCGWSPNESPWNLEDYPGAAEDGRVPPSPPSIPAEDLIAAVELVPGSRRLSTSSATTCDTLPRTFPEIAFSGTDEGGIKIGIFLTFFTLMLAMLAMPFILRNLYRKLPGWMAAGGEEGAEKTNATEEAVAAGSRPRVVGV